MYVPLKTLSTEKNIEHLEKQFHKKNSNFQKTVLLHQMVPQSSPISQSRISDLNTREYRVSASFRTALQKYTQKTFSL